MKPKIEAFVTPAQREALRRFNREAISTCDRCGKRSPPYGVWWTCRECYETICGEHIVPGSEDEETGNATCTDCRDYGITMGETP